MLLVACVHRWLDGPQRLALKQRWSRGLLGILGVRLDAVLSAVEPASLIVANHISWLDIYALNAARPGGLRRQGRRSFLAARRLAGCAYRHRFPAPRQPASQIRAVNDEIGELLGADEDVALFPEGTTSDGTQLLAFHAALLQPAVTCRPLQPVAIAYFDANGRRSVAPAYAAGDAVAVAGGGARRSLTVRLRTTPPLATRGADRRSLAQAARTAIAYRLGLPLGDVPPVVDSEAVRGQQPSLS